MFDMKKTGARIAYLRKRQNMTQMELADKMEITYQAVSNWERGDNMPDISKLEKLAQIFRVSIDELITEEKKSETVGSILDYIYSGGLIDKCSMDDIADVASIFRPDTIDKIVEEKKKDEKEINKTSFETINALAPLIDEDLIVELTRQIKGVSLSNLLFIAPFLSEESLTELIEEASCDSIKDLISLAPYLDQADLDKILKIKRDCLTDINEIVSIAPFLSEEGLCDIIEFYVDKTGNIRGIAPLLPYLGKTGVSKIFRKYHKKSE